MDFENVNIVDINGENAISTGADVIVEEPLNIIVDGRELVSVMRTPGHDRELAAGFLFSEGLIASIDDIHMIVSKCDEALESANTVHITLKSGVDFTAPGRAMDIRSSCGICGQRRIDELFNDVDVIKNVFKIKRADIFRLPDIMASSQKLSKRTRGAHAAALFTRDAGMVACFEDVGRHNALDKLIGHCLLNDVAMDDKVLLLSGRTSYEMISKALRARIPFVISISAPTSLAVEIAKRGGIAMAGILRGESMKLYTRRDDFI